MCSSDLPEQITVDVTELMLNQGVRVRDLASPANKWKAVTDGDLLIVHVVLPRAEEAAPATDAAAAAAPAEPEVIKKGKVEKEGDEKAAGDKKDEKKK